MSDAKVRAISYSIVQDTGGIGFAVILLPGLAHCRRICMKLRG